MKQNNIYIFDLHNTLYDEVIEFGLAIQEAIDYLFEAAEAQGHSIEKDILYQQLSDAHARIGSDWDDDVWLEVKELAKLDNFEKLKNDAMKIRCKTSEALTKSKAFTDTIKTIKELKKAGNTIYVATEATLNAASDAIVWLDLDGIVDVAYAMPFKKPFRRRAQITKVIAYLANPCNASLSLQKPHPLILGEIILNEAKRNKLIPQKMTFDTVFEFIVDESLDILALKKKISENPVNEQQKTQAYETLRAIRTVMKVKASPYKEVIEDIKARCFYIGDSFFKDGFLALNANVPFIYASYGKKVSPKNGELHARGKDALFRLTGWDKFLIQLTQEAEQLPELTEKIVPYFTCENSFREFVVFKKEDRCNEKYS